MTAVQFICSKIGLVTGRSLAGVLKVHYPRWLVWSAVAILVVANTDNAGAKDRRNRICHSLACPEYSNSLHVVPVTLVLAGLIFFGGYKLIERTFKWLSLSLFAYIAAAFFRRCNRRRLKIRRAGPYAKVLSALGLIGTGFLATPILIATSAYAVSDAMGWRHGLSEKWQRAKPFYIFIVVSCLIAMCVYFAALSPMTMLYWVAILNGILAPPILVLVMLISSNKNIMGEKVNSKPLSILGWATTALMTVAVMCLLAFPGG